MLITDSFGFRKTLLLIQVLVGQAQDLILMLKQSNLEVTYRPYSDDDARSMVQNRIGWPKKATKDLDFTYKFSLEDGLLSLIQWRNETNN